MTEGELEKIRPGDAKVNAFIGLLARREELLGKPRDGLSAEEGEELMQIRTTLRDALAARDRNLKIAEEIRRIRKGHTNPRYTNTERVTPDKAPDS